MEEKELMNKIIALEILVHYQGEFIYKILPSNNDFGTINQTAKDLYQKRAKEAATKKYPEYEDFMENFNQFGGI